MPKLMEIMPMDSRRIRIKKDDKVKVLVGKDKEKIGKVLKIDKKKQSRSCRKYQCC